MPLEGGRAALTYAGEREMIESRAVAIGIRPVGWRPCRSSTSTRRCSPTSCKRGRKTATIRLGDKSHKYRKNDCVLVTIGYQHSPREKIFDAVIDQVEVKRVKDLSPRDIEHDNPEFRRVDEMVHFLEQIYGREVDARRHRHRRALLADHRDSRPSCATASTGSAARRTEAAQCAVRSAAERRQFGAGAYSSAMSLAISA